MPALIAVVLLGLLGAALVIAGTYVIAGVGAALLGGGVLMFGAAMIVRSGMTTNVQ